MLEFDLGCTYVVFNCILFFKSIFYIKIYIFLIFNINTSKQLKSIKKINLIFFQTNLNTV
jgi:hypothetical protein